MVFGAAGAMDEVFGQGFCPCEGSLPHALHGGVVAQNNRKDASSIFS